MFCRQCGNRLEAGSSFCASCGAKTNIPASEADPTGEKVDSLFNAPTKAFFESFQTKGFFESLFDFSFTSLVTTKLIKFLYAVSIAGLALVSLLLVIIALINSPGAGVLMLLFAPLFFLFGVCYTRVMLEIIIVVFRIAEHTAEIAQQGRTKEAPVQIKSVSQ